MLDKWSKDVISIDFPTVDLVTVILLLDRHCLPWCCLSVIWQTYSPNSFFVFQSVNDREDDPAGHAMLYDPIQGGSNTKGAQYLATIISKSSNDFPIHSHVIAAKVLPFNQIDIEICRNLFLIAFAINGWCAVWLVPALSWTPCHLVLSIASCMSRYDNIRFGIEQSIIQHLSLSSNSLLECGRCWNGLVLDVTSYGAIETSEFHNSNERWTRYVFKVWKVPPRRITLG